MMGKRCFAAFFAALNGSESAPDCAPAIPEKAADAATIEVSPKKSLRFMTAYHHEASFDARTFGWFQHNQTTKFRVWLQFRSESAS
jgi:hypothetical protein